MQPSPFSVAEPKHGFGLKLAAVRDWERGLRTPDLAVRTLLRVIAREPDAVVRAREVA